MHTAPAEENNRKVIYLNLSNTKTYVGPRLYPWQQAVTDTICDKPNSGLVCCVKSRRQCGKSYVCEGILLHYAINYKGTINGMISPTMAQARKVYREVINAIFSSGIIKRKNETLLEIELINGSTIFFKSAEVGDGLRGYKVSGILILDEAAYLAPDILQLVLPWRQVSNAPMLVVSTPRVKDGIFFNYYKEGLDGDKNVVSIDWNAFDTSALLPPEMVEQYRRVLTANQFKSEILGEWLDDDALVFQYIRENTIPDTPGKYNRVYGGIDFGAGDGNDYTAFSVLNESGEMVYLDYFNDLSTLQQIERLTADIMSFGNAFVSINMENNSLGKPLIDLIINSLNEKGQQVLVSKINRWVTTNSSKSELVKDFQVALEQSKVKIFNNPTLINQFASYEAEYNPKTQVITYNGAYGTHDDLVMSTMLAYNAYYKNSLRGTYSIGFTSKNAY